MAFYGHERIRLVAMKQSDPGKSRRLDARCGLDLSQYVGIESMESRHRVAVLRRVDLKCDQVPDAFEAHVGVLQIAECPHKKASSRHQQKRKCHLSYYQSFAQICGTTAPRHRAH